MSNYKRINLIFVSVVLAVILFGSLFFSAAQASEVVSDPCQPNQLDKSLEDPKPATVHKVNRHAAELMGQGALVLPTTTLSISNLSTIWVLVDKQDPSTGPRVFVVEAEVVNTGSEPAEMVRVVLDYNEDPANDWILLPGEDPNRQISILNPGERTYVYWFVSYPAVENQEHEYTISAHADNAALVTTNKSVFDIPALTKTVKTLDFQRTGNTGQGLTNVDALVGAAYTITVNYDLGQHADELIFGPVGNIDFDPSATRLLSTTVSFENFDGSQRTPVDNQLYFPSLPTLPNGSDPTRAVTTYKMVALKPAETRLCAYTGVRTNSDKYDKDYCTNESVIIISGTSSLSLIKSASNTSVLQNGFITYTLDYTNSGNVGIPFAWIWDEVDPTIGSIVASTNNPAPDPVVSDENLVAWKIDSISVAGQPGSSGILTLTVEINGGGEALTDGMPIVNSAYFGISQSGLPAVKAITSTITSTLQAPVVTIDKSDGLTSVGAGEELIYTLTLQNNGSALATGLVVTETLPTGVALAGTPTPAPDSAAGNVLVWDSSTLGDLQPNGGMMTLTIPVVVEAGLGNGTILTNIGRVLYQNSAGFTYPEQVAEDMTTVTRPLAFVDGYAFDDLNGDGIFNGAETGLANVQVSLAAAVNPLVLTGGDGYFHFTIEYEGPISITTTTPSGYFHTTPGTVFLDSTFGLTQTVDFGFASTGSDFGVLFGTVFEDANQNGSQELGENGLKDILISSARAITTPVMSDVYGRYTLRYDSNGPTTVEETNAPGWVSTTPDVVPTLVASGSSNSSPIDFGDFRGIKITGMVFEDTNVNGANDGESGLAGAVIEVGGLSYTTGASGVYTIYVSPGTQPITVTETNPGDYISTNAVPVSGTSKLDEDTLIISDPQSSSIFIGDFGDVRPADLSIFKLGEPEPVAPGGIVTYTLVFSNDGPSDAETVFITDTLDSDVKFGGVVTANVPLIGPSVTGQLVSWEMNTLDAGGGGTLIYTATVHPTAEESITNEVQISAETPDLYPENNRSEATIIVGDPGVATIYGYVFADSNGNGNQDPGEAGIEGVSVSLDGAYTSTTDVNGLFTFLTVNAGVHNVVESQPNGYFSTTPDEVHVAVLLGNSYMVNFGEAPDDIGFASIFGTVFEDADSSQSWDFEEVGLKGVTVALDMVSSVETDLYGQFTFSTTVTGEHTVIETDPEFYFSTTPNTVTVELALNSSEEVNFGDVRVDVATCDADEYEEDDQYTEANELPFGQEQAHDFCDDAVDWLKVTVAAGQNYTFTTASWGQRADTYLALFDEDGKSLLAANDDMEGSADYSSQIKWLATKSGEIFVRVINRAALEGYHSDYRIWAEEEQLNFIFLPFVTVEPAAQATNGQSALLSLAQTKEELISPMVPNDPLGAIDHSCPDSYEADDTWQLAKPIVDGVPQWHSFDSDPLFYSADKDFVSFDFQSGQDVTFTVTTNLGVEVLLEVYDESGDMLGLTGTGSLYVSGLESGRYFLSASPIGPAFSCVEDEGYQLLAEKEEIHFLYIPAIMN